jgi:hypothetical protein
MPQLSLAHAENLDPAQAAELLRVLELEAAWEVTTDSTAGGVAGDLRRRQHAFEEYRAGLAAYAARYRTDRVPEITPGVPDRLKVWCQTLRALIGKAEPKSRPVVLVAKAYRLADRIAARTNQPPPGHPSTDPAEGLDAVIAWCESRRRAA